MHVSVSATSQERARSTNVLPISVHVSSAPRPRASGSNTSPASSASQSMHRSPSHRSLQHNTGMSTTKDLISTSSIPAKRPALDISFDIPTSDDSMTEPDTEDESDAWKKYVCYYNGLFRKCRRRILSEMPEAAVSTNRPY